MRAGKEPCELVRATAVANVCAHSDSTHDHARLPLTHAIVLGFFLLATAGCQQKMARQPSYRPLEASDFFVDQRASRLPIPGTVARWPVHEGDLAGWEEGKRSVKSRPPLTSLPVLGEQGGATVNELALLGLAGPWNLLGGLLATGQGGSASKPGQNYVTAFPMPVTERILQRGQERYAIFCAVCHDPSGSGRGKIVERGYLQPPNYVTDNSRGYERWGIRMPLRDAPVGYYFEVISRGYGGMPDYATQIPPADRWAIVAYIRALVFSQRAPLNELPPEDRNKAAEGGR